jgi:hypothetical protein
MPSRKPAVAIRRPPPAQDVEQFVAGESVDAQASRRSSVLASSEQTGRGLVKRKDGSTLRRTTIYFPPELATRLKVHCATAGVDLSDVVTTAVAEYLAGAKPVRG